MSLEDFDKKEELEGKDFPKSNFDNFLEKYKDHSNDFWGFALDHELYNQVFSLLDDNVLEKGFVRYCFWEAKKVVDGCPGKNEEWKEKYWESFSNKLFINYVTNQMPNCSDVRRSNLHREESQGEIQNLKELFETLKPKEEIVMKALKKSYDLLVREDQIGPKIKKFGDKFHTHIELTSFFLECERLQCLFDCVGKERVKKYFTELSEFETDGLNILF